MAQRCVLDHLGRLRVWIRPPGWRPADVAQRFPKAPFDLERVERFHPPMASATAIFAAVQFVALLAGVALFLWHVDSMPLAQACCWAAALTAMLWALGASMQGRIGIGTVLASDTAALAAAWAVARLA